MKIGGGEKKASGALIPEASDRFLRQGGGPGKPDRIERGRIELEKPPDEEGVVIQEGGDRNLPFRRPMVQPAAAGHFLPDVFGRLNRRIGILGAAERLRRLGQGGDHQSVPIGQDLRILEGAGPQLAPGQKTVADTGR